MGLSGTYRIADGFQISERGAFHISKYKYDYPEYKRLYLNAIRDEAELHVMERPAEFSSLCIDIDTRCTEGVTYRYNTGQIHRVQAIAVDVVNK